MEANSLVPFPEATGGSSLIKESVTKESLKAHVDEVKTSIDEGVHDPLEVYMQAKIGSEFLSMVMKETKDYAIDEATKYGKDERKMYGCAFELSNGTTKYDFAHDDVWSDLNNQMKEIKEKMKAREELMKQALNFSGAADDNGEVVPPAKIVGGSGEQIRITIPKS
jgi:hypothetical protein